MYKTQTRYFYEVVDGKELDIDLDLNLDLFYYEYGNDNYVVTMRENGVQIGGWFDSIDDFYTYAKRNKERLKLLPGTKDYKDLKERLNKLISKQEFEDKVKLFEEKVGLNPFRFYNDALLVATNTACFDLIKFNEYLEKEYSVEYQNNTSVKELTEQKFGEEVSDFIQYLISC